jgi:hypothetical protein
MEKVQRLDLHASIPRFAPLRLHDPVRLARLVASIERQGQLMPVVAVPAAERAGQWVLIDGYRRREALARLTQDRIWVDVWPHAVDKALLTTLSRGARRDVVPGSAGGARSSSACSLRSRRCLARPRRPPSVNACSRPAPPRTRSSSACSRLSRRPAPRHDCPAAAPGHPPAQGAGPSPARYQPHAHGLAQHRQTS